MREMGTFARHIQTLAQICGNQLFSFQTQPSSNEFNIL